MMRFWDVCGGRVALSGWDVRRVNTASLRANQALMVQETVLFDTSVIENIRVARSRATRAEVETACRKASLHDFIARLPEGYETQVGELGSAFSGGERQRVGLARAFLHDAPLLLLDEPTSNLDSLNESVVLRALYNERDAKSVVLVSHRASTLSVADEVLVLQSRRAG
jgi:ABC-type multidrug transport system fused ATPase/permease subunit